MSWSLWPHTQVCCMGHYEVVRLDDLLDFAVPFCMSIACFASRSAVTCVVYSTISKKGGRWFYHVLMHVLCLSWHLFSCCYQLFAISYWVGLANSSMSDASVLAYVCQDECETVSVWWLPMQSHTSHAKKACCLVENSWCLQSKDHVRIDVNSRGHQCRWAACFWTPHVHSKPSDTIYTNPPCQLK